MMSQVPEKLNTKLGRRLTTYLVISLFDHNGNMETLFSLSRKDLAIGDAVNRLYSNIALAVVDNQAEYTGITLQAFEDVATVVFKAVV